MNRPSLEEMNNRVRRDGGRFEVLGYSEKLKEFYGVVEEATARRSWTLVSWTNTGRYEEDEECWADLIEKPYYVVPKSYIDRMRAALLSDTPLTCLDYLNDIEELYSTEGEENE